MALIGRFHPLLIHFPIALVIGAAAAEAIAIITANDRWRTVAVGNIRAGAIFAVAAVIAGWRLAVDPAVDTSSLLEWHRWLGVVAAICALVSAVTSVGMGQRRFDLWVYRGALLAAGALVAAAGHLGGLLVWGADFLRV